MYKTNRTPSNAVPATLHSKSSGPLGSHPFIPSSVPGSDQQWKKSATRKAKTRMANKISKKQEDNTRSTEYDDKFIEWEMPNTEKKSSKAHKNHQGISLTNIYFNIFHILFIEYYIKGKSPVPVFTENSSQFKWPSEVQVINTLNLEIDYLILIYYSYILHIY